MTDPVKIGQRLSNLRGNRTLKEVANAVGISVSALAMYETGKRVPRDEIKVMLARYFNTSVEALFFIDLWNTMERFLSLIFTGLYQKTKSSKNGNRPLAIQGPMVKNLYLVL